MVNGKVFRSGLLRAMLGILLFFVPQISVAQTIQLSSLTIKPNAPVSGNKSTGESDGIYSSSSWRCDRLANEQQYERSDGTAFCGDSSRKQERKLHDQNRSGLKGNDGHYNCCVGLREISHVDCEPRRDGELEWWTEPLIPGHEPVLHGRLQRRRYGGLGLLYG